MQSEDAMQQFIEQETPMMSNGKQISCLIHVSDNY